MPARLARVRRGRRASKYCRVPRVSYRAWVQRECLACTGLFPGTAAKARLLRDRRGRIIFGPAQLVYGTVRAIRLDPYRHTLSCIHAQAPSFLIQLVEETGESESW